MLDALSAATKAVLYAGVLTCAGAVLAVATLQGGPRLVGFAARLMRLAAYGTMLMAIVSAVVLFFQLGGQADDPTLLAVFASSRGAALCLQIVAPLLLLSNRAEPGEPPAGGIQISNAVLLAASIAISGHGISAGLLSGVVVLAHVAAAAWWIGALVMLRNAWMHDSPTEFAAIVARFSEWARRIVIGLVVAGTILVVTLVDFRAEPFVTPYVRVLVLKLAVAATVLAVAASNRVQLTARVLAGDATAAAALCRRIDVELALLATLLAVTAVLTTTTVPEFE